jgi:hypothetical protein
MSSPAEREVARFLAAVRNGLSDRAVKMTAFDLADELTGNGNDREALRVLRRILEKGAEAVRRDGDV